MILFFDESKWDEHNYLKEALLQAQMAVFSKVNEFMVSLIVPFHQDNLPNDLP